MYVSVHTHTHTHTDRHAKSSKNFICTHALTKIFMISLHLLSNLVLASGLTHTHYQ